VGSARKREDDSRGRTNEDRCAIHDPPASRRQPHRKLVPETFDHVRVRAEIVIWICEGLGRCARRSSCYRNSVWRAGPGFEVADCAAIRGAGEAHFQFKITSRSAMMMPASVSKGRAREAGVPARHKDVSSRRLANQLYPSR
jgi:hypothetical protein